MTDLGPQPGESGIVFALRAAFICGPLIVTCVLCMLWSARQTEKLGKVIVTELRVLGHRFNGHGRALYIEALTRSDIPHSVRVMIEQDLARMQKEDEVREMRAKAAGKSG